MNKPLVSVIIASYNHEKYIIDAINSVLNQTYNNIELIVEDDYSTDCSRKLLKKIEDKRVKIILSKVNKGTVKTYNHLLKMCHGKYIAILGSDDIWYPEKLDIQMKYLLNNDVGAVFSLADIIDENGNKYLNDEIYNSSIFNSSNLKQSDWLRLFYESGNHLCHPSSIIKKDVLREIGYFNCAYRQLHDFEFWIRLINKYNIKVINKKLLGYRRFKNENSNLSGGSLQNQLRHINEYYYIMLSLFNNISDKLFIDGFKKYLINKQITTKEQIICEKYFILLGNKSFDTNNKKLALDFMFKYINNEKVLKCLKDEYKYNLNDFYRETSSFIELYPTPFTVELNKEVKNIVKSRDNYKKLYEDNQKELNDIYNSKSWRLMEKLRKILVVIRNGKN